jgi:hypothetical protein
LNVRKEGGGEVIKFERSRINQWLNCDTTP